jgi:hypothetical protein
MGTVGLGPPGPRLSVDWFSTVLTDTIGRETVEDGYGVFRRSTGWRRCWFLRTQPTTHTSVAWWRFTSTTFDRKIEVVGWLTTATVRCQESQRLLPFMLSMITCGPIMDCRSSCRRITQPRANALHTINLTLWSPIMKGIRWSSSTSIHGQSLDNWS